MSTVLVNLALAVVWAAMTGGFSGLNLLFGFVLGALALALIRGQVGSHGEYRRIFCALDLGVVFLWELIKSTVIVARVVVTGRSPQPAIIAYPLSVTSDAAITLLANMITLTPGTLSIDVSDDRSTLYVHALDAPDPAAVVDGIRHSFEQRIARVFA